MKRVLLTGMSGTSKSSIIAELTSQGYKAIDADSADYSEWVNVGGNPTGAKEGQDWMWQVERIQDLLNTEDVEVLFISGCAENMGQFFPQFEHIILLSAPAEIILERLQTRTNNAYGKRPEEVAQVLNNLQTVEPLLRKAASHEIDTCAPFEEVVAEVLQVTLNTLKEKL